MLRHLDVLYKCLAHGCRRAPQKSAVVKSSTPTVAASASSCLSAAASGSRRGARGSHASPATKRASPHATLGGQAPASAAGATGGAQRDWSSGCIRRWRQSCNKVVGGRLVSVIRMVKPMAYASVIGDARPLCAEPGSTYSGSRKSLVPRNPGRRGGAGAESSSLEARSS